MSAVHAVVAAVFGQMRRDRSAVMFVVVLPVGLMVLMGNVYAAEDDAPPQLAVLATAADPQTTAVVELLEVGQRVEVLDVADERSLDDAVRRRQVDAGLILAGEGRATLVGAPDVALPGGVRFVVRGAVSRVRQAAALAESTGDELEAAIDTLPPPVVLPPVDGGEARTEAAVGVLVLVTFTNLIAYGSTVPSHRSVGVLGRLGVAPVRRGWLLAGYVTAFAALALVQVAMTLVAGAALVGIDWGPLGQVAAVAVAVTGAAAGTGVLAATLLPTPESGSSVGGPIGFGLGMLGGCLWPLDFVGGFLEATGRWVPHQWAVAALGEVAEGVADTASLVLPVIALIGFGVAATLLASRRLAREWR